MKRTDTITKEEIQAIVAEMLTSGEHTGITVTFDPETGVITLAIDGA